MSYLEEAPSYSALALEEPFTLSESEDPVVLCVQSIKHLHAKSNPLYIESPESLAAASASTPSNQSENQSVEDLLVVKRI